LIGTLLLGGLHEDERIDERDVDRAGAELLPPNRPSPSPR
jgi:hypothetical protein